MEYRIHPYQRLILKKLMYNPELRFTQIQIKDLTSKHFNYHLKQLLDLNLVKKVNAKYSLTTEGKKFIAKVDEANMKVEQQPKVSVVCFPERTNKKGQKEILLSKRLKHPNFGMVVGIGGKVRFGETFEETAHRELYEETGLTGNFRQSSILRKIGVQEGKEGKHQTLLNIVFILFHVTKVSGELITKTSDQENFWCVLEDIPEREDISTTVPLFIEHGLNGTMENFEHIAEQENY